MLTLKINREENEYDVYAMVTSFYPEQGIKVVIEDSESENGEMDADGSADTIFASLSQEKSERGFIRFVSGEIIARDALFVFKTAEEELTAVKRQWKLFLYDTLSEYTGRTLPWGALTGVRPTKLIMGMLNSESGVAEALYDRYRVSGKKAELGIEIATLESKILKPFINEDGYSLYIGIPFCPSRCLYCSFTAFPIDAYSDRVRSYLDALKYEMQQMRIYMRGKEPDTVYVGGGTPTSLDEQSLEILLSYIDECVDIKALKEFTVEAGRPDSITPGKLKVMRKYGVTRISVNPQTMKEETLQLIGRRHTTEDIRRAFGEARDAGYDNINMDMILGLPG